MKKALGVFAIALFLAFCHALHASSFQLEADQKSGSHYQEALDMFSSRQDLQRKTDKAVDAIIQSTIGELRKRGHKALAGSIEMEYNQRFRGFVMTFGPGRDVGDHEAIAWLLKIHDDIEFVIGAKVCKSLRIHDLWVLAYTIPVVFSCVDHVDPLEYAKHYLPLAGITARWISYGTCVGFTFGTGIVFLCGLGADVVEHLVVKFVAPPFLPGAYELACLKK